MDKETLNLEQLIGWDGLLTIGRALTGSAAF